MDFKFLKPWRLQLFIRPDIRRNLTDEKNPIHNRHIHMKLRRKKYSGNGCAMKREDEKSRQIDVSCNDFDEKKSYVTTHSFLSKYQSPSP